jgi:proline iminopeptidase
MPTAIMNGVDLYFEQRGSGPACLVIHGGLGLDHQYLARTLTPLEERLSLTYYDQRGNGQSSRPGRESMTMEQLADDAAALIERIAEPPSIVLGHSYGGFVAQELALRHPGVVRALILVDTTPGQLGANEREDEQEQGPPLPPAMVELMSTVPESDSAMAYLMQGILPFYIHGTDTGVAEAALEGTHFSADALVSGFEVLAGWSSVDRLSSISVPTLLLWGRHDLLCSAPQAKRIANRIAGSELHYFENSGHLPWLEEPDAFFATLRDWLERNGLT